MPAYRDSSKVAEEQRKRAPQPLTESDRAEWREKTREELPEAILRPGMAERHAAEKAAKVREADAYVEDRGNVRPGFGLPGIATLAPVERPASVGVNVRRKSKPITGRADDAVSEYRAPTRAQVVSALFAAAEAGTERPGALIAELRAHEPRMTPGERRTAQRWYRILRARQYAERP